MTADSLPASRESVLNLTQRVADLEREVREDRERLYSKVNATALDVAGLKASLAGLATQCGRIEEKLDQHSRDEQTMRERDQAARTGRLWVWLAILAGWLWMLLQWILNSNSTGG